MASVEKVTLPNGLRVEYYPETHQYFVDGKEVPSITRLIDDVYPGQYNGVNPIILQKSAEYGTKVHDELNTLINLREKDASIPLISDLPEVNNYFTFVEDIYHIKPLLNERIVALYNNKNEVVACGRFDMICNVDNKKTLVDFKTTTSIHRKLVTAQLNLYLKAAFQSGYIDTMNLELGVIQLSGKVSRFIPIARMNESFYMQFIK